MPIAVVVPVQGTNAPLKTVECLVPGLGPT